MKFVLDEYNRNVPDEDLLEDLKNVSQNLGKSPTMKEYEIHGKFHPSTLCRRFGGWQKMLDLAGLEQTRSKINISDDELFKNIEDVWVNLGRQPKYQDMESKISKFSAATYANRFGGWRKALEKFVDAVNSDSTEEKNITSLNKFTPPARGRYINWRKRFIVLNRDNFKCVACGKSPAMDPGVTLHIDHIVPFSKGGTNEIENLQSLCNQCNLGKSNVVYKP